MAERVNCAGRVGSEGRQAAADEREKGSLVQSCLHIAIHFLAAVSPVSYSASTIKLWQNTPRPTDAAKLLNP